jgi:hypothetical protein
MGIACGAMYCGMIGAAIGATVPQVEQGDGQAGAAYVAAGAHTGAHGAAATGGAYVGGQAGAQRLNQLQGQHGHSRPQQQPDATGSDATASRISNLFITCVSSQSSPGGLLLGSGRLNFRFRH